MPTDNNELCVISEPSAPPAFGHYLWILRRNAWRLAGFVALCVTATVLVTARITPIYDATATVDIDRRSPSAVVGSEAAQSAVNDSDQFLATQVKLIQSDSVLRPVVARFQLRDPADPADREAPVVLPKLKITRPPQTYLLYINYRSPDPKLAADVANAVARSYIAHTFDLRFKASANLSEFMEKQLEEMRAKMERSTAALAQFERELNVINPEEKTSILSARLLQLNTEYTNAQADRVRKEAAARSVASGALEAAQSAAQGDSLRRLTEHAAEAQEKFAQVRIQYGPNHPEYRRAAAQVEEIQRQLEKTRLNIAGRVNVEHREALSREDMLRKAVAETKAEFDRLNARSFQYQQLKREAESDKKLYEELTTKIKEAGINANFQNSSIRLADPARPASKPVYPNLRMNALLALFASAFLGIAAAVLADNLDNTVRDPEEVSRALNTEVIGILPAVRTWRRRIAHVTMEELPAAAESSTSLVRLGRAVEDHASGYIESIRSLRNSILLADFDRRLKTILVTSAAPAEGKSTTAAYLALSHARQGKRTLIIDADLRRPSLHTKFDIKPEVGLTNVLVGEIPWRDAVIQSPECADLDILPAGPPSRRAADLIGSSIEDLLQEIARSYDMIVLDAAPLLGFAESLQLSAVVNGVLIVARAGETNRKSLGTVLSTLTRLRVNVLGLVLNEFRRDQHDSSYYYYYSAYSGYSAPSAFK